MEHIYIWYGRSIVVRVFLGFLLRFGVGAIVVSTALLGGALSEENDGFLYLNSLRKQTGLSIFTCNTTLQKAAVAHSKYMKINNTSGHNEDMTKSGAIGATPYERMTNVGYSVVACGENVSRSPKNSDIRFSIDGLFSAIYHRFGFLNFDFRDVGIGIASSDQYTFYTFDMATDGTTTHADKPEIVTWPPKNAADIPPVFYEERPDPLPGYGVSGYPVSVQFNTPSFTSPPSISAFTLTPRDQSSAVALIAHNNGSTVMTKDNDPNKHFTKYQAAIFPKEHLEWGTCYDASITYNDGSDSILKWSFATRSLATYADRVYTINDSNDHAFDIVSGKTYALYFVPQENNDTLKQYQCTAYTTSTPEIDQVTQNVLTVKAIGSSSQYVEVTVNKNQTITLTIGNSDTADDPRNNHCGEVNSHIDESNGTANCNDSDDVDTSGISSSGSGGGCTYNPDNTGVDLMMILMMMLSIAYLSLRPLYLPKDPRS
jgi:hypothetical protein